MIDEYLKARKTAEKEYKAKVSEGEYPFLPALDDILPDSDLMPHKPLGIMDIPVELIAGTKTRARQNAFSDGFMPLLEPDSEFAAKWSSLYTAQISEGINDPVKVIEYLHRFYVIEGNKRVSVCRYNEMPVICADVIRVMPSAETLADNPAYAEFLKFYDSTGLYDIDCVIPETYAEIAELLGEELGRKWDGDKVMSLKSAYWVFLNEYRALIEDEDAPAPGDAFAIYLKVYVKDALAHHSAKEVAGRLNKIKKEFAAEKVSSDVALVEEAEDALNAGSIITKAGSTISKVIPVLSYTPKHPFRAAFIYDKRIDESRRVADHDKGRLRLEEAYGGTVVTRKYEACADSASFEAAVKDAAGWGANAVFTTSPSQIDDTLRAAIEYGDIEFLNCSVNLNRQAVRTYYAKIYEAKFLAGVIAGIYSAADGTHRIGYCSDYPIYGTVAGINAFAIGASMTDPSVRITLDWTSKPDNNWWWKTLDSGIHVMSGVDSLHSSDGSAAHGLCYVERCEPGQGNDLSGMCRVTNLATPMWMWGKLYEIIVKTMLEGKYHSKAVDKKDRATNYWWGMMSGVVDIYLSDALNPHTRKLVEILRTDIVNGMFNPFDDMDLSSRDIIQMDWLYENIEGEIPAMDSLTDEAKKTVKVSGVRSSKK